MKVLHIAQARRKPCPCSPCTEQAPSVYGADSEYERSRLRTNRFQGLFLHPSATALSRRDVPGRQSAPVHPRSMRGRASLAHFEEYNYFCTR